MKNWRKAINKGVKMCPLCRGHYWFQPCYMNTKQSQKLKKLLVEQPEMFE